MIDFNTAYKNQSEQNSSYHACSGQKAIILSFPCSFPQTTTETVSETTVDDIIMHRLSAPLCADEMTAIMDMVKYRAKRLGQELWVTACNFLATMKVEEMEDLRRCDFVRAVEYLVTIEPTAQA